MNLVDYLFGEHKTKEKKLILGTEEEVTYKDTYDKINRISQDIIKAHEKGDNILLLSDNSVFFVTAYLGIINAGCVCVPVDTNITKEHLNHVLKSCNIKTVYIQDKYLKKIDTVKYNIVTEKCEHSLDENNKIITTSDDDVAAIMFTSGSTGTPKGVMITHKNIMNNTDSILSYLKLDDSDIVEAVLPFFYCYGASLLHTHIKAGGSLVLNNKFMFPSTVISDINKYGCTGFSGVPSTYQILLRRTKFKDTEMPTLRYITQAGGKLADQFIIELKDALKDTKIYIMYGQTEATARLSYLPPEDLERKLGSVGKGLSGTKVYIIDKDGNVAKQGEIVAEGDNIMKGYLNDCEETKKKIKDGVLYTGDIGYCDDEGYIYIVGRDKNIIKCGGKRISSVEIEHTIAEVPGVIDVAVIPVPDDILGEAIKAYIVIKDVKDKEIIEQKIMEHIKNKLDPIKKPKHIEFIDEIPKNTSGKIMFNKLRCECND